MTRTSRPFILLAGSLAALTVGLVATAAGRADDAGSISQFVGRPLPTLRATDLNERERDTRALAGETTVVIFLPCRRAAAAGKAWAARLRQAEQVKIVTVVALDLPFFVSTGYARQRARAHVPTDRWSRAWLGPHGELLEALGVSRSTQPYVFALLPDSTVAAAVHGPATPDNVEAISAAVRRHR